VIRTAIPSARRSPRKDRGWVQDTTGLPQVLLEATGGAVTLSLYGLGRLAEVEGADAQWFLGDALGSVRQIVGDDGAVTLARDYSPFGVLRAEAGTGGSGYGYTGEQGAGYTQFIFLRARWMDPYLELAVEYLHII